MRVPLLPELAFSRHFRGESCPAHDDVRGGPRLKPAQSRQMTQSQALDGAKWFIVDHFERLLVFVLVASLLLIHVYVDEKIAFLSFYYLPVIVAGFHLGKRTGTYAALLIVVLVAFVQAVV